MTDQRVLGVYAGSILAAVALTAAVATDSSVVVLVSATVVGFTLGSLLGSAAIQRVPSLLSHLGGLRSHQAILFLPAALFGLASLAGLGENALRITTIASASVIVITGYALLAVASTRYTETMTNDKPIQTCRWQPPRTSKLNAFLLVNWLGLAVVNAIDGSWFSALIWSCLGTLWLISGLVEGRFRLGEIGTTQMIRIHEHGFVKQRPYTSTFVHWETVNHVRLRDDELVFDRGLFDTRLECDSLESPEDVRNTIETQLSDRITILPTS
ncbi:hypothetical protein C482_05181 [Natrialba chahannaoensis JCM 10990]|uniref:Uncharacterized protein n=1 Tax=Natrialba chahannaoensis JCM 10990 TaxID=1227492 RepID=M0AXM4_9EURY|nr:hypothetical protein C482_05181 [Natrialba chahannaoensis JCM 10990]